MGKIHTIYFSYSKDADMLKRSIASLRYTLGEHLGKIWVINDSNNPICEDDVAEIIDTNRCVNFSFSDKKRNKNIKGLEFIREMWEWYSYISNFMEEGDYLFKTDSDVLVVDGWPFQVALQGRYDAIGVHPTAREAFVPPRHFAGVGYFLKKWVAEDIGKADFPEDIDKWNVLNYPEDMVTSSTVARLTENTHVFSNFQQDPKSKYFTDTFLQKVDKQLALRNALVHCRSNTQVMKKLYNQIYES